MKDNTNVTSLGCKKDSRVEVYLSFTVNHISLSAVSNRTFSWVSVGDLLGSACVEGDAVLYTTQLDYSDTYPSSRFPTNELSITQLIRVRLLD